MNGTSTGLSAVADWTGLYLIWGGFNTLVPEQNGGHFAETYLNAFPWTGILEFQLRFHWSLFSMDWLTIISVMPRYCILKWHSIGKPILKIPKKRGNNRMEEIGLVTPIPEADWYHVGGRQGRQSISFCKTYKYFLTPLNSYIWLKVKDFEVYLYYLKRIMTICQQHPKGTNFNEILTKI